MTGSGAGARGRRYRSDLQVPGVGQTAALPCTLKFVTFGKGPGLQYAEKSHNGRPGVAGRPLCQVPPGVQRLRMPVEGSVVRVVGVVLRAEPRAPWEAWVLWVDSQVPSVPWVDSRVPSVP